VGPACHALVVRAGLVLDGRAPHQSALSRRFFMRFALGLDDGRVMREPIQQRGRQRLVAGNTVTHSADARFVVTTVVRRS